MRPSDLAAAQRIRVILRSGEAGRQRDEAGMTAADFARVLGVSRQAVRSWETGGSVPTVEHAVAYGKLLASISREAA